jgi:hypothetical protein
MYGARHLREVQRWFFQLIWSPEIRITFRGQSQRGDGSAVVSKEPSVPPHDSVDNPCIKIPARVPLFASSLVKPLYPPVEQSHHFE